MRSSSFILAAGLALLAGATGACSSHAGDGQGSSADGATLADAAAPALCGTDPRAQTFTPGMEQAGTLGKMRVRLLTAAPAPPAKGNNVWSIEVVDESGAPRDGLALGIKPYMPDHGHGTSITPEIAPAGSGKYDVTNLNLFMPGVWTITFSIESDAGATDSATFTFCIPG